MSGVSSCGLGELVALGVWAFPVCARGGGGSLLAPGSLPLAASGAAGPCPEHPSAPRQVTVEGADVV